MALAVTAVLARAEEARPHTCDVPGAGRVLCATLPVWENRAAKSGRKIDLNIVILPALHANHAPDPVFILDGGPGAAATRFAPAFSRQALREQRDIVLIDQRGTGGSHKLDCDFYGDPPDLQRLMSSQFPLPQVRECREQLQKIADLAQYTTAVAMDDIDQVRQWLGYRKVNLWGASYGSLAAQVYLRRHEENVRTAVLIDVLPADELMPLHHASAGQRAIDIFFDRCRTDADCNSAYPRVRDDFARMFERVRSGTEARVRDRGGNVARVRPSVGALAEGIRHRLYNDTGKSLAGMIHQAAEGDLSPVVQAAVDAELALRPVIAKGVLLSVTCSEDLPYITAEAAARETRGTFLGELRIREQRAACAEWVRGPVPPDTHRPLHSQAPVLLISGYLDPVTPPEFAERVAGVLPNSRHVVFPLAAHGGGGPCGRTLVENFVKRGSAAGLDVSCVSAEGSRGE